MVYGGITDSQEEVSAACYAYDPHTRKGFEIGSMLTKRYAFTQQTFKTTLGGEDYYEIYAIGGGSMLEDGEEEEQYDRLLILNKCERLKIACKAKNQ